MSRQTVRVKPKPAPSPGTPGHAVYVLQMLIEYFGSKKEAIAFMRAHASCAIVIPGNAAIEKLAVESQIVAAINRDPSPRTISRLNSIHDLPKRQISKIYKRAQGVGVAQRRRDEMHCRTIRLSRLRRRVRV